MVVVPGGHRVDHGVARIQQRAEDVVRQLCAAGADGDMLGAEPGHIEQMCLEPRQLLAAFEVAERRRVATALVEGGLVVHDLRERAPQPFRRRVIDPAAAEGDHVIRVQAHRDDVLAFGHFHDLADRRWVGHLAANQGGQAHVGHV